MLRLQARQPGSREHLRVSVDYDRVERTPDKFNLVIQRVSRAGSQLVDDQEVFDGLSMDPTDERFIVDALQDSELVRLVGPLPSYRPSATAPANPGQPIPYITVKQAGSDGEDLTDYDVIGSNAEGTGLFALDRCERVDLVCVPSPPGRDLGSTSFLAATRYCERRRALLVWDPPWAWTSADSAVLALRASAQASRHALTYFPRVRPRGDLGRYAAGMPACGVVAGMLARCDQGGVWHRMPPVDTTLKGGLAPLVEIGQTQAAILQRMGVNTFVRLQPGVAALQGNVSFAGTATIDALWQSLSASRLAAFIVRSIETETRWVFTAERPDQLAADLERQVWVFLSRLKQHGAFAGATAEQAFFVRTSAAHEQGRRARRHDRAAHRLRAARAERVPDLRLPLSRREPHDRGAARARRRAASRLSLAVAAASRRLDDEAVAGCELDGCGRRRALRCARRGAARSCAHMRPARRRLGRPARRAGGSRGSPPASAPRTRLRGRRRRRRASGRRRRSRGGSRT